MSHRNLLKLTYNDLRTWDVLGLVTQIYPSAPHNESRKYFPYHNTQISYVRCYGQWFLFTETVFIIYALLFYILFYLFFLIHCFLAEPIHFLTNSWNHIFMIPDFICQKLVKYFRTILVSLNARRPLNTNYNATFGLFWL